MVYHVEHGPGDALGVEREDSEHEEAEMRDRAISDHEFEIALAESAERTVDDAERGERSNDRQAVGESRVGREREDEAQDAVSTELGQNRGEQNRNAERSLVVRVG